MSPVIFVYLTAKEYYICSGGKGTSSAIGAPSSISKLRFILLSNRRFLAALHLGSAARWESAVLGDLGLVQESLSFGVSSSKISHSCLHALGRGNRRLHDRNSHLLAGLLLII